MYRVVDIGENMMLKCMTVFARSSKVAFSRHGRGKFILPLAVQFVGTWEQEREIIVSINGLIKRQLVSRFNICKMIICY